MKSIISSYKFVEHWKIEKWDPKLEHTHIHNLKWFMYNFECNFSNLTMAINFTIGLWKISLYFILLHAFQWKYMHTLHWL